MEITEVEIHEFDYQLHDVAQVNAHQVYCPGETVTMPGFVLTIRTDEGIDGHYRGSLFVKSMIAQIEGAASEFLIGRDPRRREEIWYDIWQAYRHTDHLGLGPIDVALWDIAGKYYDESVSNLLGRYRDRVPAYASTYWADDVEGGLNSPEAYAEFAEECYEMGYRAFKIHPDPWGDVDRDIAICRAVAEAVGDRMDLMLDPTSEYDTYAETLKVGRVLDELGFFWYEDPMAETGQSIHMNKRLSAELDTPILGCEHSRTGPFGRVNHMSEEAADLVRSDANLDGGITGLLKIANAVEAFGMDTELHTHTPAHLQCISAIRNTNYYEHTLMHPQGINWVGDQGLVSDVGGEINDDGTVTIPDDPGLGIEIDWDYVTSMQTDHTLIDTPGVSGTA